MTEKPLYPFGYGLSYTTFAYKSAGLSKSVICKQIGVKLSIDLQNSGKRDGDEVVQVYSAIRTIPTAR